MKSESMEKHKKDSPLMVKIGIITLSDSKSKETPGSNDKDLSGKIIKESLEKKHQILSYQIIPDDAELLLLKINEMREKGADVVITTGGTGVGKRDITIETLKPLFQKELNGFGEIFRYESYKEIGTGAILSRAIAGVYQETLLVALPGSPNAVELGMKIIKPELRHLVKHLRD
jgi:molybdenum cofactor biosynthesis protein B